MPQIGGKSANKTSSSTTKRNFTVVIGNKEHGLYVSSSPSSAARKAVSKLCATDKKRKVQFSIREITQGSKKKTYGPYVGKMKKLDKPIELKGRVIKYSTDVYLDKTKTAVKMGKNVGNKIKGGKKIKIYNTNTKFFYCTWEPNTLKDYINELYEQQIKKQLNIDSLFTNLEYVSYGHVLITNRSIGYYLRKNNKPEQITVYACYNNNNCLCYAILRCDDYVNTNIDFYQDKILFLIPKLSKVIEVNDFEYNVISTRTSTITYKCYEFKSYISSNGDIYRIICKDYPTFLNNLNQCYLCNFFNSLTDNQYNKIIKCNPPISINKRDKQSYRLNGQTFNNMVIVHFNNN